MQYVLAAYEPASTVESRTLVESGNSHGRTGDETDPVAE